MNPLIQPKTTPPLLISLALLCFAVLPRAQAVAPPPDGGYSNFTTAEGHNALFSLTTGSANTAVGWFSLWADAEGSFNTATGAGALLFNTSNNNTAFRAAALLFNTTGSGNTAIGTAALLNNTIGTGNTANGFNALYSNTSGGVNTVVGINALFSNTSGQFNTAVGINALLSNTTGAGNTAIGELAFNNNTTGIDNIAVGNNAGGNLTIGLNNIDICNEGVADESNTIRIGTVGTQTATFIAGISVATVTGTAVVVNASGQLGVAPSSQRFKDEIKPMDKTSEAILALKPVTFRYKKEIDPKSIPQFGLVAEEVEKVNPDLVVRDKDGKPYTVRYDQVNAMLLNEFLKEHRTVQEQKATVAELKSILEKQEATNARQQKQIEALIKDLQKVSAQLKVTKLPPQLVNNDY
jgi:uncharacterized coiled-coil protein SlyX